MRCARKVRGTAYLLPEDVRSDRVTLRDVLTALLMLAMAYGWLLFGLALA